MYGLEKKAGEKFEFDLEDEIKKSPEKAKKVLDKIEKQIHEIKASLKKGVSKEESEELGVLLHGYVALQKVLTRVVKP